MSRQTGCFSEILVLEDNASAAERTRIAGVGDESAGLSITIRVHRLDGARRDVVAGETYEAGSLRFRRSARIELARKLIERAAAGSVDPVIVAGTSYGSSPAFLAALSPSSIPFVVQVRPGSLVGSPGSRKEPLSAERFLSRGKWTAVSALMPDGSKIDCSAAKLARLTLPTGKATLFAAQVGGIRGVHRGTIIALSSFDAAINRLVRIVAHARWIRRASRQDRRAGSLAPKAVIIGAASALPVRSNIALSRQQDARSAAADASIGITAKGGLLRSAPTLNVIELFAGAGGMGLGFLLGGGAERRYRIVYSGEADPIFTQTLRQNHYAFEQLARQKSQAVTPSTVEPTDLRERRALDRVSEVARDAGRVHLIIGGPPCQGFSMANRNSWSGTNPHNELVDVFIKYILRLRPLGFLMENVQGILWTPNGDSSISVVDTIERRLRAAGFLLFPKLLDAVWYGVPQNRTRFFLMGIHRDLGCKQDDFDAWGPFPRPSHGHDLRPFVTVREAIADLPRIGNGESAAHAVYDEPSGDSLRSNEFLRYSRSGSEIGTITEHITSRHAKYVIDRYKKIPAGGNWQSIRDQMTNYADVSRTHSNIYRRLRWDEPSITIGHYRKSMLIHPSQHRGLSLREASRLQSFPDWFRFAGTTDARPGGLVHKQQQLANAVCPLVTKAIAEFMLNL